MEWLVGNWYLVLALLAVVLFIVFVLVKFLKLPNGQQMIKIKEWLLFAVLEAEKKLGDKTGKLKLREVYDMFVVRFPFMSFILSFDDFEKLVNVALDEMRVILETNDRIKEIVKGA